MLINGIVAMDNNKGIGKNNNLPWNLKSDLNRFQRITTGNGNNALIIGKNTWNSIKFLRRRDHLILSTTLNLDYKQDENIVKSFKTIYDILDFIKVKKYDTVWVIGGSEIYKKCLQMNLINELHITLINDKYDCDTFFPDIPENYSIIKTQQLPDITNNRKHVYSIIYKQLKEGDSVYHNNNIYTILKIHYDNFPELYFTIKDINGKEKQTVSSNIKLQLKLK
jgi:dihydrofolate reductase